METASPFLALSTSNSTSNINNEDVNDNNNNKTQQSDNWLHSNSFSDAQAIRLIKESWIRQKLNARLSEYTRNIQLDLFAFTWNVNGKLCTDDLSPIFSSNSPFDICFIGLQEVDMSAESILLNDSPREEYWSNQFSKYLTSADYSKLISKQLGGIIILVYAHNRLSDHISDINVDSKGCGILGFGNKGGVGVRMRVYDTSICVVNSHLAADRALVERRNADYEEIAKSLSFTAKSNNSFNFSDAISSGYYSIWDSDILLWFGDLNYRIDLPEFQVKEMLKSTSISDILKYDQLKKEQSFSGGAFSPFTEGDITFRPSYKYDPGTSNFDSSEKKRTPSWCDRILYRKGDAITVAKYDCAMNVVTSDHKPVFGIFKSKVRQINAENFSNVHQSILRDLDKMENEAMPDCKLSVNHLDFDLVEYLQPVHREIVLENIGNVAAKARFIPKLDESAICKSWMWINPPMSIVMPGEKLVIRLTILVDNSNVTKLNIGEDKLEDILILHLENGKDFFVSVTGKFVPTCFGMDIELLDKFQDPIEKMSDEIPALWMETCRSRSTSIGKPKIVPTKSSLHVPKELWRIVDYIYHFGLGLDGLFLTSGDQVIIRDIRRCLDSGNDFRLPSSFESSAIEDSNTQEIMKEEHLIYIHSMAETLIRFLEALPTPVIPHGVHYQRCIDSYSTYSLAKHAISLLPTPNYNIFVYITSFLREIVETSSGKISADTMAVIFSSVILQSQKRVKSKYYDALSKRKATFVLHFLTRQ